LILQCVLPQVRGEHFPLGRGVAQPSEEGRLEPADRVRFEPAHTVRGGFLVPCAHSSRIQKKTPSASVIG